MRESSPSTIGGPFNMSSEVNASLVETICLEAPESMMKLGELDVPQPMHELSLYLLNLTLFLSPCMEGRCHSSQGVGSACLFASSYKSF